MRVFEQITPLRAFLRAAREDGKTVGLVPTMGALHDGHVALMKRARAECDVVVVSIFVNPTQFGPNEDYQKYPRELKRDSRIVQQADADALFAPAADVIYPAGAQAFVEVPEIAARWEGECRPGHFKGVATVCAKLFNIVCADRVYFGQKDYQQLKVIERMVADLHVPVKIVPVATVRDKDGLALSSRNAYLNIEQRDAALAISRALNAAHDLFQSGELDVDTLEGRIKNVIASEPAIELQYAAVVDAETLAPLDQVDGSAVAILAAKVGETRLIDNVLLQENGC